MSDYKVGDRVVLSSVTDMGDVKKSFLNTSHYIWDDRMIPMLGKQYPVLEVVSDENGIPMLGLPSPDGSQNGKWYFPESVIHAYDAITPKGNKS